MRHLFLLMLTYLALILESASGRWSLPAGTAPLFLYMTAAVALLVCEGAGAIFWATFIGLLCDALSRGPLGLNVVLLANLAFFGQLFGTRTSRDSIFAAGGMMWVFVTLAALGSLKLSSTLHGDHIDPAYLGQYAAGRAGASVALFVTVMLSCRIMNRSLRFVLPSVRVGADRRSWAK